MSYSGEVKNQVKQLNKNTYKVLRSFYIDRNKKTIHEYRKRFFSTKYNNFDHKSVFRKGMTYVDYWPTDGSLDMSDITTKLLEKKYIKLIGISYAKKD